VGPAWRGLRRVNVPPDEATLRQIAALTGGQFFSAPTAQDLQAVYQAIGTQVGYEAEERDVTVAFIATGLALLVTGAALAIARSYRFP
jgi:Ca-activated chloride channel family protein